MSFAKTAADTVATSGKKKLLVGVEPAFGDRKTAQESYMDVGVGAGHMLPIREIKTILPQGITQFQQRIGGSDLLKGQDIWICRKNTLPHFAFRFRAFGGPSLCWLIEVISQVIGGDPENFGGRRKHRQPEQQGEEGKPSDYFGFHGEGNRPFLGWRQIEAGDRVCKLRVPGYFLTMFKPGQDEKSVGPEPRGSRFKSVPKSSAQATAQKRQRSTTSKLQDKQSEPDFRQLRIDKVGVRGLRFPITVKDKEHTVQNTVATIGMFVDLPKEFKGTHMSRFLEVLNAHGNIIHVENLNDILFAMQEKFQAATSHLEIEFPYFMVKKAPITKRESVMDYIARFDAAAFRHEIDFVLTVKVTVTTLCPCSKAIAAYGAHNQRGVVTVQIRSRKPVWIEDLIGIIEGSASSELYALLKREDEKAVTERAYENPVFVEDLVRNVALKLNAHADVTWYKVEAENQESIHNHNAYACIEKG